MVVFSDSIPDLRMRKSEGDFFYRAAALIIQDGKLLAVKNEDHPGLYYTVGGAVCINETTQEAVVREAYEEIGVMLEIDKLAFVNERFIVTNDTKCHEIVFYHIMKGKSRESLNIADGRPTDQGAAETLHWLPLDSLNDYNLVPGFLRSWNLDNITTVEHIISKEY